MGIDNASLLVYAIKGLSILSIKKIVRHIHFQSSTQTNTASNNHLDSDKIHVDVDCNWVACQLGGTKSPNEAASITCDFLLTLAEYGFVVTPICDGVRRHHSKRATISRIAKREKSKLDSVSERFNCYLFLNN